MSSVATCATSSWNSDLLAAALRFAAEAHGATGKLIKGTSLPYICHPVMVAFELSAALPSRADADADLAMQCALLHDTIEDTDVTYEDIADEFGRAVADGVAALSKRKTIQAGQDEMKAGRLALLDSLERICRQPEEIWMVKLADRIVNLSSEPPPSWDSGKRTAYLEEAGLILERLGRASPCLAERLKTRMFEYEKYL